MFHLSQIEDDEYLYESEGVRMYSTVSYDRNEKLTTTLFKERGDTVDIVHYYDSIAYVYKGVREIVDDKY